jgi:linoleoyl-CoA desaturase
MVKIKFSASKDNAEFIVELRNKVKNYFEDNELSKYGNLSIVLKSLFMLLLFSIPYILMLSGVINTVYLTILCWVAMGIGMAGLGMVLMHDASHGSFSQNNTLNKWLSKSLFLLGGFPPNWRYQHNTLHHGYTNIDGHDEDIAPVGILRFSPHQPLNKVHKYQYWYAWFFYGLMTLSWVTVNDFSRLNSYKRMSAPLSSSKSYNRLFIELIFSKVFYYLIFLILPILLIQLPWYWILLGFLTMHFISGLTLTTIFQTAHVMPTSEYPLPSEDGRIDNNWAAHQLFTTSDYSPKSRIFSWLIGGLNYQIEHHLFPNISHVHYRKLSVLVKNTAQKHNLPYNVQPSFVAAVYSHIKMLKLLGR